MTDYTSTGTQADRKQGNGSTIDGGLSGAAGEAAAGLMAQVKSRASSQVAAQQVKAADGLGTVASALRKAGNDLRSHNESLASYADMAVDELEHISSRIREKSPGEYVADIERFARSRPAAFVGGTFLLGLGLARFLKSTQPRRPRAYPQYAGGQGIRGFEGPRGYGNEPYRGYAGQGRSYDAPGATSGTARWPESTGSATPPAPPGRTPTSASSATSATGATSAAGAAGATGTTGVTGRQQTTDPASGASKSAANRNRGTGDPS